MNKEFLTAYEVLCDVYINKQYVNTALNEKLKNNLVNHSLVTKLCYGVLEKDITLNYFLKNFFAKKPKQKVYIVLKMAGFMHLFLNSIPDHAITNELVEITKLKIDKHLSGFVNASIKNILKTELTFNNLKGEELLSVKYSYPIFVISSLLKHNSLEFVEDLLQTKISTKTNVRVNLNVISNDNFEKYLKSNNIEYSNNILENNYEVDYENLLKLKNNNYYFVQGIPSQVVVLSLNAKQNSNILDMCAAPGGKSVYASLLYNSNVIACDIYEHRVNLIQKYASLYDANKVTTKLSDATILNNEFVNNFDFVLLDAPCSGTGVICKKPDIILNKTYSDVLELSNIQLKMLENASKYVKVGGILTYSTCSIMFEENEQVINKFLKTHSNFKIEKINTNLNVINRNNLITFYPNISNTEGFFIGRLKRYE